MIIGHVTLTLSPVSFRWLSVEICHSLQIAETHKEPHKGNALLGKTERRIE